MCSYCELHETSRTIVDIGFTRFEFRDNYGNYFLKVEWYPKRDQKVGLNMVKKDQLCAIALGKRKSILIVSLKMVAIATAF